MLSIENIIDNLKINEAIRIILQNGCLCYDGEIVKDSDGFFIVDLKDKSGWSEDIYDCLAYDEIIEDFDGYKILDYQYIE